jgi:NAD(P)-dependent dehydrogenase (short-subunit alcohol dehydrogenase family)
MVAVTGYCVSSASLFVIPEDLYDGFIAADERTAMDRRDGRDARDARGALDGRVAIITGAGHGLGREHALLFAREGAAVVVNDIGGDTRGEGADAGPAQRVVDEIVAAGGRAVANTDSAADWDGAARLIDQAVEAFGDLHVLVNNAGILRDRMLVNMTEQDWDSVMQMHLKGHFCPTRHAARYWRDQSKAGRRVNAALIHTSSASGVLGNAGQTNYGAAKAGIAAFSAICALELGRYGVRSNAITPNARTRLTAGLRERYNVPDPAGDVWDPQHPGNVSPMVAYLATEGCAITGELFHVAGDVVLRYQPHVLIGDISSHGKRWRIEELEREGPALVRDERRGGLAELRAFSQAGDAVAGDAAGLR